MRLRFNFLFVENYQFSKNIFKIPNINPVSIEVKKDLNKSFVNSLLFEKSMSNNP